MPCAILKTAFNPFKGAYHSIKLVDPDKITPFIECKTCKNIYDVQIISSVIKKKLLPAVRKEMGQLYGQFIINHPNISCLSWVDIMSKVAISCLSGVDIMSKVAMLIILAVSNQNQRNGRTDKD